MIVIINYLRGPLEVVKLFTSQSIFYFACTGLPRQGWIQGPGEGLGGGGRPPENQFEKRS